MGVMSPVAEKASLSRRTTESTNDGDFAGSEVPADLFRGVDKLVTVNDATPLNFTAELAEVDSLAPFFPPTNCETTDNSIAEKENDSRETDNDKQHNASTVDGEATNTVDGEATNTVDGEATNTVEGEATNTGDGEATNTVEGGATNTVEGEATNTVEGGAENTPNTSAVVVENLPPEYKIFVGGLHSNGKVTVQVLDAYFCQFGPVKKINHKIHKGIAFVHFLTEEALENVFVEPVHKIRSRVVTVSRANRRDDPAVDKTKEEKDLERYEKGEITLEELNALNAARYIVGKRKKGAAAQAGAEAPTKAPDSEPLKTQQKKSDGNTPSRVSASAYSRARSEGGGAWSNYYGSYGAPYGSSPRKGQDYYGTGVSGRASSKGYGPMTSAQRDPRQSRHTQSLHDYGDYTASHHSTGWSSSSSHSHGNGWSSHHANNWHSSAKEASLSHQNAAYGAGGYAGYGSVPSLDAPSTMAAAANRGSAASYFPGASAYPAAFGVDPGTYAAPAYAGAAAAYPDCSSISSVMDCADSRLSTSLYHAALGARTDPWKSYIEAAQASGASASSRCSVASAVAAAARNARISTLLSDAREHIGVSARNSGRGEIGVSVPRGTAADSSDLDFQFADSVSGSCDETTKVDNRRASDSVSDSLLFPFGSTMTPGLEEQEAIYRRAVEAYSAALVSGELYNARESATAPEKDRRRSDASPLSQADKENEASLGLDRVSGASSSALGLMSYYNSLDSSLQSRQGSESRAGPLDATVTVHTPQSSTTERNSSELHTARSATRFYKRMSVAPGLDCNPIDSVANARTSLQFGVAQTR